MPDRRPGRLAVAGVAAALCLGLPACSSTPDATAPFHGSTLKTPWKIPATSLTATDAASYSFADEHAPLTLVFFGYTNCPDVCSQEMADITSALVRIPKDERDDVDVVFVTTDPKRDTVPALKRYLGAFDPDFVGVTGQAADLTAMAEAFHVYAAKAGPGGQGAPDSNNPGRTGYLVEHTDYTFAVQHGRATAFWNRDTTSQQLAQDISHLLEE
ncbi:SCO family protein [Nocardioides jiangxiensis]|uniref:SCO family protein n=1 Tax=Nocardioides jiangxiensis TaxID=3064524 RepID=A0ABT9B3F7_9ACTN|nr:SCO family protein [Nocardioides sp. WY-20]MDO7869390.1 SCO family protein [Nocardioides sp. WY-20]